MGIDTALILLPQTFQLFKWSFIQDSSTKELLRRHSSCDSSKHSNYDSLSNLISSQSPNGGGTAVFIPHLQLLAKRLEAERKQKQKDKKTEKKRTFFIK